MNSFLPFVRGVLLITLLAAVILGNTSPVVLHASAATQGCGSWQIVHSPPNVGLSGVAAISHANAWAVGAGYIPITLGTINTAIVEHWDGTHWKVITSPQPGNYRNDLYGVAALSPSDVWAVGSYQNAAGGHELPQKTLIEHWDGTHWGVIASPNAKVFYNGLSGVATLATNDIWAVGSQGTLQGLSKTLVEHWDGTRWSIVTSPNVGSFDNALDGVAALAPDDIWAAGESANGKGGARTLIEHWNGQQWSVVPSPSIGSFDNFPWSIAAVAPHDVWMVGLYWAAPGNITNTLTEHWNGSTWSVVASPNPPGGDNGLHGVAAIASNDVWAAGFSGGASLIIHWDGHQWSQVVSPTAGLFGMGALNAHDLWAVGDKVMHYC